MGIFNSIDFGVTPSFGPDFNAQWTKRAGALYDALQLLDGNIVGTVSQSGGVPTRAIIERGGGPNGEYVRLADGTQICAHTIAAGSSKALGAGTYADPYRSADITWTFPASFLADPRVTGDVLGDANGAARLHGFSLRYVTATGISQATAVRLSSVTTELSPTVHIVANGRWY